MLTPLPPVTVGDVLRFTLPYFKGLAGCPDAPPRLIAYGLAYDRRLMREVDADRTTLARPASPALVCLSSRLIDALLTDAMAEWEAERTAALWEAHGGTRE